MSTALPHYIVICGSLEPYITERNVEDATWAATVRDVADGQFMRLTRVLELGTGRDVTDRIVREAADLRSHRGDEYSHAMFELVELHLGTRTARAMVR